MMRRREMLALLAAAAAMGPEGARAAGKSGGSAGITGGAGAPGGSAPEPGPFAPERRIAWCIVPFDARNRNPEERAEMLHRLGIRRFAYDWRNEHLPTLDRELDALQKYDIRLDAFWFPAGAEPQKEAHVALILDFLRRRKIRPQLWLSTGVPEQGTTQEQRIETAGRTIRYVAAEAEKIGSRVGLYNHGGWFGEPENQIAIIEHLRMPNVGIVYNLHHGHPHIDRFPELFRKMQPHLLALNLNGMRREGPKILGLGEGDRELEMLRVVAQSDYRGLIGILGHREEVDAEFVLRRNLRGLDRLVEALRREGTLRG